MNLRPKKYEVIAGVVLVALLSGAFVVLNNFSGKFSEAAGRIAQGVLSPGWFLDVLVSGNAHAGFGTGDWRDFTVIVVGTWVVWMLPIVFISRVLSEKKEKEPNQTPEPTPAAGRGSS